MSQVNICQSRLEIENLPILPERIAVSLWEIVWLFARKRVPDKDAGTHIKDSQAIVKKTKPQ